MAKHKTKLKKQKKKSRLNTRLLMIIGLTAVIVGGIGAGLLTLRVKGSVSRNIYSGTAYMAEQNWDKAERAFGRVLRKDPSNSEGMDGLLEVYSNWVPSTREHAMDLRRQYFSTLIHDMRYHPGDNERAIRVLETAYRAGRLLGGSQTWNLLQSVAKSIREDFPADSDAAVQSLYFTALSRLALETERFTSERDNQGNVIFPGEVELVAFLEARPDDDQGLAQLSFGRMAVARRLGLEEQFQQEARNLELAEATFKSALAANPNGPATLLAYIRHLVLHDRVSASREERQFGVLTSEELDAVLAELALRLDQVEAVFRDADDIDPFLLADFVQFVRLGDRDHGHERSVDVINMYLKAHPDDDLRRLELAESLHALGDSADSMIQIRQVLDADPRSVAAGAAQQYLVKALASKVLFDTAADGWATADDVDKDSFLESARGARTLLVELLQGDDSNNLVIEADGRIAFMDGDMRLAASKLEKIAKGGAAKPLTLRIDAVALEAIGQPGLAVDRLISAVAQRPDSPQNRLSLAALYGRLGHPGKGLLVLQPISASVEANEDVRNLRGILEAMQVAQSGGDTSNLDDPVLIAVTESDALYKNGDLAGAIERLKSAIASHGEDPGIVAAMVAAARLEAQADNQTEALRLLALARARRPDDDKLKKLEYALSIKDPIERIKNYIQDNVEGEDDRVRQLQIAMEGIMAAQVAQRSRHERAGNQQKVEESRLVIERAQIELDLLRVQVAALTDDTAGTFLLQFRAALRENRIEDAERMILEGRKKNHDQAGGHLIESELLIHRYEVAIAANDPESQAIGQRAVNTARRATQEAGWNDGTWRQLGRVLQLTGDNPEARLAWAEAWRRNPSNPATARSYAQLLLQPGGDKLLAARVLGTAVRGHREDLMLVEDWLSVETAFGDRSVVLSERRRLRTTDPDNRANAIRLAGLLVSLEPTFELMQSALSARQWLALQSDEQQRLMRQLSDQWQTEAGEILDTLADAPDATLNLLLMHASALNDTGRHTEMLDRLSAYVDREGAADRDDQVEILSVAQFLLEADRASEAVAFLRARRDRQSEDAIIDVAIGGILASSGRAAEAEGFLRDAVRAGNVSSEGRLVEVLLQLRRLADAKHIYAGIIERAPDTYETTMLGALIARAEQGKAEINNDVEGMADAQARYRAALEEASRRDPSQVSPYLELISSLIREYRRTIDRSVLEKALRYSTAALDLNPDAPSLVVQRALVLEALGKPRDAANDLEIFLRRSRGADDVRIVLAQMHVAAGTPDRASRILEDAIANGRNPAAWRDRLAVHVMTHHQDRVAATGLVAQAWADEPNQARLDQLRQLTLTTEPWDHEAVYQAVQQLANRFAENAEVRGLQARAEAAQGLRDHARETLREAWVLSTRDTNQGAHVPMMKWFEDVSVVFRTADVDAGDAFITSVVGAFDAPGVLAGHAHFLALRGAEGDHEEAASLVKRSLSGASGSDRLRLLNQLGSIQLRAQNNIGAIETFREVVRRDATNPVALNNLAWLLATLENKPDEALPLARQAIELSPLEPSFLDTLTEVYVRQGDHQAAMSARLSRLRLQPNSPDLLKEIAEAWIDQFQDAQSARPYAERVLELAPRDSAALDLAGWIDFQSGKAARAEDRLKQSIRRQPTARAHLHLAQVLAKQGRTSQAIDHLRQAEALSSDTVQLDQIAKVRSALEGTG